MARLAGKKAFITGGAQGLGACFARMFAAEGAQVAVTDVNADGAHATAEAINKKHPGAACAFSHDVTKPEDWDAALDGAVEAMGGINVLVNNAGVGSFGSIETETWEGWRRVMSIDVDAIFLGTQKAMPHLKAAAPGSIINISSVAGLVADRNYLAYNTAKAGVWMITKSIALHCARNGYEVRCNSVHPVFINTPILDGIYQVAGLSKEVGDAKLGRQIPMGRIGQPEDIGWLAVYLASDESKFVTGSEFKVDGGITAQ